MATFDTTTVADGNYEFRVVALNGAGDTTISPVVTTRIVNGLTAANTLLVGELTGAAFQHFVQGTNTQYYNPVGGAGTFSLESVPQNMPKGITFVGQSSNSNRDGSPLQLNNPGVFNGDVMLAAIGVEGGFGNVTPPAGWTAVTSINSGTTYGQIVYRKTATAGGAGVLHVHPLVRSGEPLRRHRRLPGRLDGDPVDVSANQANASSTNVVAPTVTTTTGCARLVGLFSSWAASSMTPPGGMTERFDVVTNEARLGHQRRRDRRGPEHARRDWNPHRDRDGCRRQHRRARRAPRQRVRSRRVVPGARPDRLHGRRQHRHERPVVRDELLLQRHEHDAARRAAGQHRRPRERAASCRRRSPSSATSPRRRAAR